MQTGKGCFSLEDVKLDIHFVVLTFPLSKRNEVFCLILRVYWAFQQKPSLQMLAILWVALKCADGICHLGSSVCCWVLVSLILVLDSFVCWLLVLQVIWSCGFHSIVQNSMWIPYVGRICISGSVILADTLCICLFHVLEHMQTGRWYF